MSTKVLVILGPTASGKSDLAVALAKRFGGEVISADSRQVYRGLDLGSGKITRREMRGIPHHLLDVASPRGVFTAARYRTLARRAMRDIVRRGKLPIVAGGTAFYINALLYDAPLPEVAPDLKLRSKLEQWPPEKLFDRLQALDPARAGSIDPRNKRRLVRALEIVLKTGKPVPPLAARAPIYDAIKIGITLPEAALKTRIQGRLLKRLRQGLVVEVKKLHADGLSWKRLDDLGLEYRFVSRYLRGLISRDEMITAIERESWAFARRQMTWWRSDRDIAWVRNAREAEKVAAKSLTKRAPS